jgi:Xaa-Pro aminopeptidase
LAVAERLHKLRQRLLEKDLDGIIITQPDNCRYISGFTGSGGTILVSQSTAILVTDFIYAEQAKQEAPPFHIIVAANSAQRFSLLLSDQAGKRLGFEPNILTFSDHQRLAEEAGKAHSTIVPAEGMIDSLRSVKEAEELALIEKAAALADSAVRYIMAEIRPGMTEKEAGWEIEKYLRERNSEAVPFDIIVASGPNAALPHARPTERPISTSEPIIIDLGARVEGYCSDISRTLCLGHRDDTFRRIYDLVLEAQLAAMANIEAGMTGARVDGLARTVIEHGGYKEAFGHGLGHGLGLAVHEEPRIGPNSTAVIAENAVFTIEPGIYISGWGGVRIEDTVLIEKGKARPLTRAPKTPTL